MERTRRVVSARLSEVFGAKALPVDRLALRIGYRRIAEETWTTISEEDRKCFQAYADGVNDFYDNVKFTIG